MQPLLRELYIAVLSNLHTLHSLTMIVVTLLVAKITVSLHEALYKQSLNAFILHGVCVCMYVCSVNKT